MAQKPPERNTSREYPHMSYVGMGEGSPESIAIPPSMGDDEPPIERVPSMASPSPSLSAFSNLNNSLAKDSSYNNKKRQESIDAQINAKTMKINNLVVKYSTINELSIIKAMDFVEELIGSAGGESRVNFLEVDRKMIKIATRIPMKANLHPMLEEGGGNPRFHKFITQILLSMNFVDSVKWVPVESGSLVIIELV